MFKYFKDVSCVTKINRRDWEDIQQAEVKPKPLEYHEEIALISTIKHIIVLEINLLLLLVGLLYIFIALLCKTFTHVNHFNFL